MVCGGAVFIDLPLRGRCQPVHGVGRGATRPQHVRGVQHDAQWAGDIGAHLQPGDRGLRYQTVGQHLVDGGLLEPVQQLPDRLVDPGDPGDGRGAGDDTDLVGGVAGIVGLPQRVAAPPPANIGVDHRHEIHRLAEGLAQFDEERDVGGVQQHGCGIRMPFQQRVERQGGMVEQRLAVTGEQRLDGAGVAGVQTRLGALQHGGEPIPPTTVQPRRVRGPRISGAVVGADRQLDVAAQPLQIGHLGDIAEVRLGGGRHRRDDLVATGRHRLGVTGDLVEQPAAPRCGVVDLVDVGTELASPGSHSVAGLSGTHPGLGARGVDQQLLDRRRGGGLQTGHRGGADQDAVDRHQRISVGQRPAAGEVFGGLFGRADTAAHADGEVGLRAQFGIGGQQQVVEVFPGVVATGPPALDVGDDVAGRNLGGDPDHRADLLDGARFEADVLDAGGGEFVDEVDGVGQIGQAGADDQPVDRDPGRPGLLDQPLAADLQFPQVGIQE